MHDGVDDPAVERAELDNRCWQARRCVIERDAGELMNVLHGVKRRHDVNPSYSLDACQCVRQELEHVLSVTTQHVGHQVDRAEGTEDRDHFVTTCQLVDDSVACPPAALTETNRSQLKPAAFQSNTALTPMT